MATSDNYVRIEQNIQVLDTSDDFTIPGSLTSSGSGEKLFLESSAGPNQPHIDMAIVNSSNYVAKKLDPSR